MRAYSTARRISSLFCTQRPSSVIATTPACLSEPIGASSSPIRPFEIVPVGNTFTHATSAARSRIHAIVPGLSAAGEVFGMQTMVVNPPAAAARAPVSIVSFQPNPGSRRCTWRSISPGATTNPVASITSASEPFAFAAIFPSTMNRSPTSSRWFAGSMIRPFRMIVALINRSTAVPAVRPTGVSPVG